MKITPIKPTTTLKEGDLTVETVDMKLTTRNGRTLRFYERTDGKLVMIGDIAIRPMGHDELVLEVVA